jgi:hypothetical protein
MELDHGLLLILGKVPTEFEGRFNEWYDEDHAPARLSVPGIVTARRYKETSMDVSSGPITQLDPDSSDSVTYLTLYELARLDVLDSDEYRALSAHVSSDLEVEVKQVAEFDRRVYRAIATPESESAQDVAICGSYVLCLWRSSEVVHSEKAVQSQTNGLLRTRRYRLDDGQGANELALYDIESREAVDAIIDSKSLGGGHDGADAGAELRLFKLHRRFDLANPPPTTVNA